ncbi:MAG: serine/threonine-protein phosphatase [Planctomycetes bacterium]|nr:serine/threonine-protein phosphatase [Planctomycetota bacterium]
MHIQSSLTGLDQSSLPVLIVCDGVGGNVCGEVAARLGVSLISQVLAGYFSACGSATPPDDILDLLAHALEAANSTISEQSAKEPQCHGMSATVVCAVVVRSVLYIAWAGDSRCYVCRGSTIRPVTQDHSEVQRLIDANLVPDTQMARLHHPMAHTIYQYLGRQRDFRLGTRIVPLRPGDRVLLCTDGLTDVVTDQHLATLVSQAGSTTRLADVLVDEALRSGTHDNVTVVLYEPPASALHSDLYQRTLVHGYADELAFALHTQLQGDSQ